MPIIDFHTHFFPDKVAREAIAKMEGTSDHKAFTDGTSAGLIASMDRAGIQSSVSLPVATNREKVGSINRFGAQAGNSRLFIMAALHPVSPDWRKDLEEALGLGFVGVKLHPDYQEFKPDDHALLPFFAALRDSGTLVVFHAGEDLSYRPPYGGEPARLARLLDQVPGLKMVATHMGGYRMWDEVENCLLGKPVYMDTSFSFGEISDERIRAIISRQGDDYIMFGTDSPWLDQETEVKNLLRLGLGTAVEEKIFYANAVRLIPQLAALSCGGH